jgi:hypothetical protein
MKPLLKPWRNALRYAAIITTQFITQFNNQMEVTISKTKSDESTAFILLPFIVIDKYKHEIEISFGFLFWVITIEIQTNKNKNK